MGKGTVLLGGQQHPNLQVLVQLLSSGQVKLLFDATVVSVNLSAPKRSEKFRDPLCAQGPFRHYIINFLWIFVNIICIILTIYHLLKLHRDYTTPSADTVRVATLVTSIASADSNTSEVPYYDGILDKKFDISRHNLNPSPLLFC